MANTDGSEQHQQKLTHQVIVHRDERGYGFTVTGDNPVYVQTVKESMSAVFCHVLIHCSIKLCPESINECKTA